MTPSVFRRRLTTQDTTAPGGQGTDEFPYIFDTLSTRVLDMPDNERLTETFDSYSFKACLMRMGAAFKHIKFPEGMMQLEKIVDQVWSREMDAPIRCVLDMHAMRSTRY